MHLISALAGGVIGAESGTAVLYRRGTTIPATWYSDFEGPGSASVAPALDSTGAAVVYVNELVTVRVLTSTGAFLKSFVAGADSPNVEVKSLSQTGTNYETAVVAAGQPTTLQVAMDRWLTSAGAPDWNVLVGSTAQTLQSIAAGLDGIVFNVKDPSYGAVADGSTDDAAAIQLAIDAADAAGGGTVFFPAGTYYIASTLDMDKSSGNAINLLGAGSALSTIDVLETATAITLDPNGALQVRFTGLTIQHTDNASVEMLDLQGSVYRLVLNDIVFGNTDVSKLTDTMFFASPTGSVSIRAEGCIFNLGAITANFGADCGFSSIIRGCEFLSYGVATVPQFRVASNSSVTGCIFNPGYVAFSTGYASLVLTGDESTATGNVFRVTDTVMAGIGADGSNHTVHGNSYDGAMNAMDCSTNSEYENHLGSRQYGSTTIIADGTVTVNPNRYSTFYIKTSTDPTVDITLAFDRTVDVPYGTRVSVLVQNTTAGDGVVTFDNTTIPYTPASSTILTLRTCEFNFVAVNNSAGGLSWLLTSGPRIDGAAVLAGGDGGKLGYV